MIRSGIRFAVRFMIVAFILMVLAGTVLYFYIQPKEPLGFNEAIRVPLQDRIEEVLKRRELAITLTEAEINGYAAEELQEKMRTYPDLAKWNITGMHIDLQQEQMNVHVQIEPGLGIQAVFRIGIQPYWNEQLQQFEATITSLHLKDIPIPTDWIPIADEPIIIQLGDYIPNLVKIKNVVMDDGKWLIRFGLKGLQ